MENKMLSRKWVLTTFLLFLFCANATAQSFLEKEQYGVDLTHLELTVLQRAEYRWCENKSPDFKNKAKKLLATFESFNEYKKFSKQPEFRKLQPDADAYIASKSRNSVEKTCSSRLESLKWVVENKKW
jgi:hypothetical protein